MSINFSNEAKMAGSDHHIETRDHGRGYSQIRMWLRTVLLSSLLVLSHEIVSRLAAVGASYSPEALSAFRSLSPLIFLTLLWIGFTLLEMSDSPRLPSVEYDGVEVESWAIFERTWMEFVLNSILLSGWIISAARCINVPDFIHLGVLPVSLLTVISAVMGLQLQIVLSIAYHAVCQGSSSVLTSRFWNERSGYWDRRIMLDEGM